VLLYCDICSAKFSETVIVPVFKSVTRLRLLKTESPSVRVTVNSKLCRLAIALKLPVVPSGVYKCSIKPIQPIHTPSNSHETLYVII
jgi:hypothetical protein